MLLKFTNVVNLIFQSIILSIDLGSMLLHTTNEDQVFSFSYVPICFPIVHYYLSQCQIQFEFM